MKRTLARLWAAMKLSSLSRALEALGETILSGPRPLVADGHIARLEDQLEKRRAARHYGAEAAIAQMSGPAGPVADAGQHRQARAAAPADASDGGGAP